MKKEIKDNEILIFTDFNNTFVDFFAEYDYNIQFYEDFEEYLANLKHNMSKCLRTFEKETGLTPVICIVTNASMNVVDNNGYRGICYDLMMTLFDHGNFSEEQIKHSVENTCEKYIRFILHKENDVYMEINPYGKGMAEMFRVRRFSDKALEVKHSAVKRESVERFITDFGPIRNKFVIFAGDSIIDDYPMKYAVTEEGVSRIFIRPGHVKNMKPSIMQKFCQAKGVEFDCVNPKNNKKVKVLDATNLHLLSDEDREKLFNYDDGDAVLLTSPNSNGFIDGIYKSIDIIKAYNSGDKEKLKDI